MSLIICPGMHHSKLTDSFLEGLRSQFMGDFSYTNVLTFPAEDYPAYSAVHIIQFLRDCSISSPLVLISFSAGVAGAIGAAWMWQLSGGQIKAFIAVDGWGVPLGGDFPIHRLSHDYFTHWSSAVLGGGEDSFYADPAVEHLELWESPQTTQGWWVHSAEAQSKQRTPVTAAEFLTQLMQRYGETLDDPP